MKVINFADFRLDLKKWLDKTVDDFQQIIVKRKSGKDVVLISLEEYNSLKETNFLLSGSNRNKILNALEEVKSGKTVKKDLIED